MKGKILIVEDNEINLDILARRLQRRDFEIVSAMDGLEGIEMALAENPDLILMDMSLPKMSGWEVTGRLKKMKETESIPVIALTAHAMQGDREKALEAGCDGYETKPVDLNSLLELIDDLLNKDQPQ